MDLYGLAIENMHLHMRTYEIAYLTFVCLECEVPIIKHLKPVMVLLLLHKCKMKNLRHFTFSSVATYIAVDVCVCNGMFDR